MSANRSEISRLAKMRKPEFTSVNEDFRIERKPTLPLDRVYAVVQLVESFRAEARKADKHPFATPQEHV